VHAILRVAAPDSRLQVYGGSGAHTGPTLSGCSVAGASLVIKFDTALLRGDTLSLNPAKPFTKVPGWWINATEHSSHDGAFGGTLLYVQSDPAAWCMESMLLPADFNASTGQPDSDMSYCPTWAGGRGPAGPTMNTTRTTDGTGWVGFDSGWTMLNFTRLSGSSITADLAPLQGRVPTAVRYAWGAFDCCDMTDPLLYVTHGCVAECPIMSMPSNLPANPFQAKIVAGKCACVPPQVC